MSLSFYNRLYQQSNIDLFRFISTSKIVNNHYDVLNLSKNCSAKDIKDSFIKLSKEHHPDLSKSKDSHNKFLKINEAYKVLSKTESRRLYDLGFSIPNTYSRNSNYASHYKDTDPWRDPSFYRNRNRSQDKYHEHNAYYGIKGIKKVSNLTVVIVCISLTVFVVGLQVMAIRNSFTFRRDELIKRSNQAQDSLREVKQTASINGNELQIRLLKLRLRDSAINKSDK